MLHKVKVNIKAKRSLFPPNNRYYKPYGTGAGVKTVKLCYDYDDDHNNDNINGGNSGEIVWWEMRKLKVKRGPLIQKELEWSGGNMKRNLLTVPEPL